MVPVRPASRLQQARTSTSLRLGRRAGKRAGIAQNATQRSREDAGGSLWDLNGTLPFVVSFLYLTTGRTGMTADAYDAPASRCRYLCVPVSTDTRSPTLMNRGTEMARPHDSLASFIKLLA